MDGIRYLLAILFCCLGFYLAFDLFVTGFDVLVLAAVIGCFVIAHYIKPESDRDKDANDWVDLLDIVIDFPFKMVALFVRSLSGIFRRDGGGIDVD